MAFLTINGGRVLSGEVECQGSKNSALPILAACFLAKGKSEIHNCPRLSDIEGTINILKNLGCGVVFEQNTVFIDSTDASGYEIPEKLMHEMRSSIIFLGAILGRSGRAVISTPGGCDIGLRPIDLHISAMKKFGANVNEEHGLLDCECKGGLKGTALTLGFPSVGATENIILAAATAQGTTTILNAAREPEVTDLADFLNACGAKIHCGSGIITVEGVKNLHGASHNVIPDRIVSATYLCAAAITRGEVTVKNVIPAHLGGVLPILDEMGCDIKTGCRQIKLTAPARLKKADKISTQPYPGFPTDLQALFTTLASVAQGTSVIVENIFECRFKHVPELLKMGAHIKTEGRVAIVEGIPRLSAANVVSTDLRGSCALVLAGLCAGGTTVVSKIHHLERGYAALDKVLADLGASIIRTEEANEKEDKQ